MRMSGQGEAGTGNIRCVVSDTKRRKAAVSWSTDKAGGAGNPGQYSGVHRSTWGSRETPSGLVSPRNAMKTSGHVCDQIPVGSLLTNVILRSGAGRRAGRGLPYSAELSAPGRGAPAPPPAGRATETL